MKLKQRIICLLTTTSTFFAFVSGYVQAVAKEVLAINSSIEYGDANNDGVVDTFDLVVVREALVNNKSLGENILLGQYAWELRQFILDESNEFLFEKVHDNDNDKLSDWEENNTYETNSQLADTDGDSV